VLCFYLASSEQLFKLKASFKFNTATRLSLQAGQKKLEPAAKRSAAPNQVFHMTFIIMWLCRTINIQKAKERRQPGQY